MRTRFIISLALVVIAPLVASFSPSIGYAQTGVIHAKVIDAKTGKVLARATIQIVETKQGAYTKADGYARLINVTTGKEYHVTAKCVGYNARTISKVKVLSNDTTEISFKLVTAKVDVIIAKKATVGQERRYAPSNVQSTPGRLTLEDIIRLTPGVYTNGTSGSDRPRGTENFIRINGVETVDPMSGHTGALQNSLSQYPILLIGVETGGGKDCNYGHRTDTTHNK